MKMFYSVGFFLMNELLRCCIRLRISWRRLLFLGTAVTFAIFVLHLWFLSQPLTDSSYNSFNGPSHLDRTPNDIKIERIQLMPVVAIVSSNSSIEMLHSKSNIRTKEKVSRRKRKKKDVLEVTATPPPPPKAPPSPLQRYIWSLKPHEALMFAKREIEQAPIVTESPELYAPLYQNVSAFKRSYEFMEMILKVYIYHEGKKPVFHQPRLSGIYASEGWFMKLLEENRDFVTKDPEKAHLFYLPYSVHQLEASLYDPKSHDLRPLSVFLRDYVNWIAHKYPFWNRTHGSDHFFVACHDWGPYTTTAHKELKENTIKALCNADLSEGFFKAGKDVSLPETSIRTPKRPLRYIGGGNRVSQRSILAFFAGHMHGRVRPKLVKYWGNDEDMKIYRLLPVRIARKMSYIQHMKSSRFCICPMGFEVNSPRIVESIYYECVPVIIADNFVLPLSEVLNWSAFSVVVAEKDIPRLKEILLAIPLRRYLKLLKNAKMVQKHFIWNHNPVKYDLFHMILHSIWLNRLNQIQDSQP